MKRFIQTVKAVIMKTFALVLWPVLFIFNIVLKVFTSVYRFVSYPIIVFGMLVTVVTFFDDGFSTSLLNSLMTFAGIGAAYFLLPLFPPMVYRAQILAKNRALSPVVVRSRLKFTL